MFEATTARWKDLIGASHDVANIGARRASRIVAVSRFMRQALQVLMLGAGAYLVIRQLTSPGAMIAATILLGRVMAPIESAIGGWRTMKEARGAYRRLKALLGGNGPRVEPIRLPDPPGQAKP